MATEPLICQVCKADDDPSDCESHGLCCDACHDADDPFRGRADAPA